MRCRKRKQKERGAQDVQVGNDSSPETLRRTGNMFEATVKQAMADEAEEKKNGSGWNKNKEKEKKRRRRCVQP